MSTEIVENLLQNGFVESALLAAQLAFASSKTTTDSIISRCLLAKVQLFAGNVHSALNSSYAAYNLASTYTSLYTVSCQSAIIYAKAALRLRSHKGIAYSQIETCLNRLLNLQTSGSITLDMGTKGNSINVKSFQASLLLLKAQLLETGAPTDDISNKSSRPMTSAEAANAAANAYSAALILQPYLFEAVQGLARLGCSLNLEKLFENKNSGLNSQNSNSSLSSNLSSNINLNQNTNTNSSTSLNSPSAQPYTPITNMKKHTPNSHNLTNSNPTNINLLYKKIYSAVLHLSRYECREAISTLNTLPKKIQSSTPIVQSLLGRAHFELVEYADALVAFRRLRGLDPMRARDMEIMSTLLWHLRLCPELAYLSHQLVALDRAAPEAWCAIGNALSLVRNHDAAMVAFQRAITLDPEFAYAHTLLGHEYVAADSLEQAAKSFRTALRVNVRHYNAWYGLGMVFLKQAKVSDAYLHFSRAYEINPTNSILLCCLGMCHERKQNLSEALEYYTKACTVQPKSPLARYRRARVLVALKDYPAAIEEFSLLKVLAPDEANVHFLLGSVYKVLGDKNNAIKHFTTALNLDPKGSHLIKEALES